MLLNSLHVHSMMKIQTFFTYCVHCATFIYSYIHTSCDVLWSTISQKQSIVSCVLTIWVIVLFFFFFVKVRQCVLAGAHLSMNSCCSVRGKKKPTGQQTPNQSAHSWGAGVTQEQKCLASSGGKNMLLWCHKIPELYISAIQANS